MRHDELLYMQVKQELEDSILSGRLAPGQRVPSVRSLAAAHQVNPDTIQRALRLLREEALICPGRRCFSVTRDTRLICRCREKKARLLAAQLRANLSALGYGEADLFGGLLQVV